MTDKAYYEERVRLLEHDRDVIGGNLQNADKRIAELETALTKVENDVLYWQGRAAEMEDERDALQGAIRKLRTLLSKEGVYSICRSNGEPMTIADAMIMGNVLEAIDQMLEADHD